MYADAARANRLIGRLEVVDLTYSQMLDLVEQTRDAGAKEEKLNKLLWQAFESFVAENLISQGNELNQEEKHALWVAFLEGFELI